MSKFTFTPAKDYGGLLKQANAMSLLIRSMEKQKAFQNVKISDMAREFAMQGFEEINSKRAANEQLTNRADALEQKNERLRLLLIDCKAELHIASFYGEIEDRMERMIKRIEGEL